MWLFCHRIPTTFNLSYKFPILETSATASYGTIHNRNNKDYKFKNNYQKYPDKPGAEVSNLKKKRKPIRSK